MNIKYNDYPFNDVLVQAAKLIEDGATVHQKFTCRDCGNRLTIETPNTFHRTGTCDNCGALTNIEASGCNYLAIFDGKTRTHFQAKAKQSKPK
jgi:transposase-like protein